MVSLLAFGRQVRRAIFSMIYDDYNKILFVSREKLNL
jgi:hypothetical protein